MQPLFKSFCQGVAVLLFSPMLWAQEDQIEISQVQFFNLGVKTGALKSVQSVPLLTVPAQVSIPPSNEYIVSSSLTGLVSKMNAALGDQVSKGEILALIDSPALLTLQRQYLKSVNESHLARLAYERDKKLQQQGVISDRRWQESRSRYNSRIAEVNEAKQLLHIAGMSDKDITALRRTRKLSSRLSLRTPIDGVVLERKVVAGERLDEMEPIYRIADLQQLWLEIYVPQEKIGLLQAGDQVLVQNTDVGARISLVGQSVNPQDQTILVRAVIEKSHPAIRAGQTVSVQLTQSSREATYRVPNAGLAQHNAQSYLFALNDLGFKVVPVNVLGKRNNYTVISGKLDPQQQIAVRGAVALKAKWLGLGDE